MPRELIIILNDTPQSHHYRGPIASWAVIKSVVRQYFHPIAFLKKTSRDKCEYSPAFGKQWEFPSSPVTKVFAIVCRGPLRKHTGRPA